MKVYIFNYNSTMVNSICCFVIQRIALQLYKEPFTRRVSGVGVTRGSVSALIISVL